jgi:hypothetical protein
VKCIQNPNFNSNHLGQASLVIESDHFLACFSHDLHSFTTRFSQSFFIFYSQAFQQPPTAHKSTQTPSKPSVKPKNFLQHSTSLPSPDAVTSAHSIILQLDLIADEIMSNRLTIFTQQQSQFPCRRFTAMTLVGLWISSGKSCFHFFLLSGPAGIELEHPKCLHFEFHARSRKFTCDVDDLRNAECFYCENMLILTEKNL